MTALLFPPQQRGAASLQPATPHLEGIGMVQKRVRRVPEQPLLLSIPGPDRPPDPADDLAREIWHLLRRKPLGSNGKGYLVLRDRVVDALEAGYTECEIRAVFPTLSAWSQRSIEIAFSHNRAGEQADYLSAWRQGG